MTENSNLKEFHYTVIVCAETEDQADQVMGERLGYDEDYGFEYQIRLGEGAQGGPSEGNTGELP